jgi:hypothetical protein
MTAAKRLPPGRPRKFGQGRINLTVRSTPERHAALKAAAATSGRSVSEEVEARLERLAQWEGLFKSEQAMIARLGQETDDSIVAAMHRRQWGKVVDPRYGGPVYIRPGQHALPSSGFVDLETEARDKEERAAAQREQEQRFEEAIERAISKALAKARLTIGEGK